LNYAVAPMHFTSEFPFLMPIRGGVIGRGDWLRVEALPRAYTVEDVTGVVLASPFVLFSVILAGMWVWPKVGAALGGGIRRQGPRAAEPSGGVAVGFILVAAAIAAAAPTLAYRHAANRFELDYIPLLMIASTLGAWEAYRRSGSSPRTRRIASFVIVASAAWTALAGILLGAGRT